jgi:hypothetical protein
MSADDWIDDVADLQAGNVATDRGLNGSTPWDRS